MNHTWFPIIWANLNCTLFILCMKSAHLIQLTVSLATLSASSSSLTGNWQSQLVQTILIFRSSHIRGALKNCRPLTFRSTFPFFKHLQTSLCVLLHCWLNFFLKGLSTKQMWNNGPTKVSFLPSVVPWTFSPPLEKQIFSRPRRLASFVLGKADAFLNAKWLNARRRAHNQHTICCSHPHQRWPPPTASGKHRPKTRPRGRINHSGLHDSRAAVPHSHISCQRFNPPWPILLHSPALQQIYWRLPPSFSGSPGGPETDRRPSIVSLSTSVVCILSAWLPFSNRVPAPPGQSHLSRYVVPTGSLGRSDLELRSGLNEHAYIFHGLWAERYWLAVSLGYACCADFLAAPLPPWRHWSIHS